MWWAPTARASISRTKSRKNDNRGMTEVGMVSYFKMLCPLQYRLKII